MLKRVTTMIAVLGVAAAIAGPSLAAGKAEEIVTKAQLSVEGMTKDEAIGPYVRRHLKNAKGVLIVPQMLKGAFGVGAEGGSGVLLVKDAKGTWSYPAFYTLGAVSLGLQIGGSASEVMLLLMTDRGVKAIVDGNRIKLGADLGVAAGPVGGGAEAAVTLGSADVLVYSRSKGAYIGISLEGSVIEPRKSLNKEYYGAEVESKPIVIDRKYSNAHATGLRSALSKARQ
ncbi:MAG: lipid-binding SYLF domain-containing protein [Alphaproteobacteria bacterium]|nr:lipid-binding SYLF domain-containing protein [Alphaproteobacteria bacterium]